MFGKKIGHAVTDIPHPELAIGRESASFPFDWTFLGIITMWRCEHII